MITVDAATLTPALLPIGVLIRRFPSPRHHRFARTVAATGVGRPIGPLAPHEAPHIIWFAV